ncbi:MAG: extracellular solute-binding protein [Hoeflea sp.]|nr:extracellular solute-binding protein [Hoeflea sp.]
MIIRLAPLLLALATLIPFSPPALAQDGGWRHATSMIGEPKYPQGFARFDYVNPDAPKGGTLRLSEDGTFDSLNPILAKGELVVGLGLVFDTLMKSSDDEISSSYGLLAESISFPEDISQATFRLRAEAKWADGMPVTPEDVIFSFTKAKELNPLQANYYAHVVSAEKTGDLEVTFTFDEINNRELPQILGQFLILPEHWWEGTNAAGTTRDIGRTTLEPLMGSGPYRIASVTAGSKIRYERRDDYWARDLNVNVGQHNFDAIEYTYFSDRNVEFEAFRAGTVDYYQDNSASHWATAYDFPAIATGEVVREEIENPLRAVGIMQALVPNMRLDKFKDVRVRRALNFAFDFEGLNTTLAHNQLTRVDSYFWGTELASSGLPEGREKEILEGMRDRVPPEVFTTPYTNPVGGGTKARENLRQALTLFREAGYELKDRKLVKTETGEQLSIEILLASSSLERSVLPYISSLKDLGIDARIRTVDGSQYQNRVRSFNYDMIWVVWAQTLNPGNEQAGYWGSKAVEREGSRNYAGIADPAIDELIRMVIFAKDRDEQVAAIKALDRVLLAHHYVVPLFYSKAVKLAFRKSLAHPAELPYYSTGFPEVWWMNQGQ